MVRVRWGDVDGSAGEQHVHLDAGNRERELPGGVWIRNAGRTADIFDQVNPRPACRSQFRAIARFTSAPLDVSTAVTDCKNALQHPSLLCPAASPGRHPKL